MNVKFKMPKFGRKLTGGGMMKELLLTILATTISIVLTFGTAHLIEHFGAAPILGAPRWPIPTSSWSSTTPWAGAAGSASTANGQTCSAQKA